MAYGLDDGGGVARGPGAAPAVAGPAGAGAPGERVSGEGAPGEEGAGPGIDCLRFVPPADADALGRAWQDHLAPVFAVSFRPDTDLTVPIAMRTYHLGELIVGDVIAPAHTLDRTPAMIREQGLDQVLLQFYRRGRSVVEIEGARGHPPDVRRVTEVQCVVFDLAQPVRIVAEAVDATNVVVPRALLERHGCDPAALHAAALDHDGDPFGRLVHDFAASVVACGDLLDRREAAAASAAIVRLCAAWLRGRGAARAAPNQDVRVRVRRLVEEELGNPDLDPAMIARRLGLSRSTLYRLFAPDGIVSYVRDRRLMRAMRQLARDEGSRAARVSQVAYAVGFSDERTFRRAFKRRFGFIPSDAPARRAGPDPARRSAPVLHRWIESL